MKALWAGLLFPLALALISCDVGSPDPEEMGSELKRNLDSSKVAAVVDNAVSGEAEDFHDGWAVRKLIRSALLRIEVESVHGALEGLSKIVASQAALIADRQISSDTNGAQEGVVTVRVPSTNFESLLAEIKGLGKVSHVSVSTRDITKNYADLETRLAVKLETKSRLLGILQTQTGKLSDLLEVERELERVVTEIERMKGERRYYDQRVAVSTITLELFESASLGQSSGWSIVSRAFGRSFHVLATSISALVYLIFFVAPWLVIAGFIWLMWRTARKRRRSKPGRTG